MSSSGVRRIGVAILLGLGLAAPMLAVEARVETKGNQNYANINEFGASIATSAIVEIVVSENGIPNNLGLSSYGSGTSAITLPAGFSVTMTTAPPGGCLFTPTMFTAAGGRFAIRVVPFLSNPACKWLAGDYTYWVTINVAGYQGTTLGVLTIK